MDFHTISPQDLLQQPTTSEEFQYDDAFYGELRRQVMQLTAEEDDDDDDVKNKAYSCVSSAEDRIYKNWVQNDDRKAAAPAWMLSLWKTGNGTGVFIPQTTQYVKKNRPGRRNRRGRRRQGCVQEMALKL